MTAIRFVPDNWEERPYCTECGFGIVASELIEVRGEDGVVHVGCQPGEEVLGEAVCEEHHIVLTPHIVTLGADDEHALPEQLVCRLCFLEDAIYEQGHRLFALQADNHRLRAAIGRHRERVFSLGLNVDRKGNPVHGSEWDRDLWSALYGSLTREDTPPACPTCNGERYDVTYRGYPAEDGGPDPCPTCNGSGTVQAVTDHG